MTREDIVSAVYAAYAKCPHLRGDMTQDEWERQQQAFDEACEQLCARLRRAEGREVYHALFSLACSRYDPLHTPTALAGHLLLWLKPPCPVSCQEAIQAVSVSDWDLSEEEVIWYLAGHFGPGQVSEVLDALEETEDIRAARARKSAWYEAHPINDIRDLMNWKPPWEASDALDTVRYWLGILVSDAETKRDWQPLWRRHRRNNP